MSELRQGDWTFDPHKGQSLDAPCPEKAYLGQSSFLQLRAAPGAGEVVSRHTPSAWGMHAWVLRWGSGWWP